MTEKQYKEYEKITEEIKPLKDFLFWCGVSDRYKCRSGSNYGCRLITRTKNFLIGRKGYGAIGNTEVCLPAELQKEIVEVVENYVERKEKELEQL